MSRQPISDCWGRLPYPPPALALSPNDRSDALSAALSAGEALSLLPAGNHRSYGDVGVNAGGTLLSTRFLDRFIAFDKKKGTITVESGLLLTDLLDVVVKYDWFLPVTPGTRYASVGGALANDVHGKNHHREGTFGTHVVCFELLRSDGERLICSRDENADYFAATIGGLGLTGLVTWVELQLKPILGPWLAVTARPFNGLDEFFDFNQKAEANYEYTVAWIDCLATTPRGIYFAGNHDPSLAQRRPKTRKSALGVPFTPPVSAINRFSLKAFNTLYYQRHARSYSRGAKHARAQHFLPFFYPLDGVAHWNRLYGKKGFYQYQCAIPTDAAPDALTEILSSIARSGQGSFLAVLKTFGNVESPGLLSFPLPGATLALDFANRGASTQALFKRIDHIVAAARGRLYPAKDANMSGAFFRASYPQWEAFSRFVDPRFSSSFWRRVTDTDMGTDRDRDAKRKSSADDGGEIV